MISPEKHMLAHQDGHRKFSEYIDANPTRISIVKAIAHFEDPTDSITITRAAVNNEGERTGKDIMNIPLTVEHVKEAERVLSELNLGEFHPQGRDIFSLNDLGKVYISRQLVLLQEIQPQR
jgi:hypothetical protein